MCHAYSNAHKPPKTVTYGFDARINIFFNAHKPPKTVAPAVLIPE